MNDIWSAPPKKQDLNQQGNVLIGRVSALNEAQELLKNGILVETNKGLICVSLKDALVNGVGGHNLSVEDFHSVATQLLFQEGPISKDEHERHLFRKNKNLVTTKNIGSLNERNQAVKKDSGMDECHNPNDVYRHAVKSPAKKTGREYAAFAGETLLMENDLANTTPTDLDQAEPKSASDESLMMSTKTKSVISVQSIFGKFSGKNDSPSDKTHLLPTSESILIKNELSVPRNVNKNSKLFIENCLSCEETSDNSEAASTSMSKTDKTGKKRGGWPKGRKRKPEFKNEMRPPKAPATGYVIFLNEKRKDYKDLPFTEVTKLLGNEWSKLSLRDKKLYLDQAEIEKKRYREELRVYRQSDAYQAYLHKKRLKKGSQGNGTEESDMDATDEIDDEDNEELYCRSCDQWFHSLHNKREHLYGRQHLQSLASRCTKSSDPEWLSANASSTSLDESSLDGSSCLKGSKEQCCNAYTETLNMDETIVKFMVANKEREHERLVLKKKLDESMARNQELSTDLKHLNETFGTLTCLAESEKTAQILLEQSLFNLLNVPTLFYLPEPVNEDSSE